MAWPKHLRLSAFKRQFAWPGLYSRPLDADPVHPDSEVPGQRDIGGVPGIEVHRIRECAELGTCGVQLPLVAVGCVTLTLETGTGNAP